MTNYTIIIPHKNIPDLLCRCLDSIPIRDDVQIIVVDDNSEITECNGINLTDLPQKYSYVEWRFQEGFRKRNPELEKLQNTDFYPYEKKRKGAGYARNLGLERAKGKWLVFADADDFFNPCLNECFDKYVDDENDIIFFYLNSVYSENIEIKADRVSYINDCLDEYNIQKNQKIFFKIYPNFGKFIKSDMVIKHGIKFQETKVSNDVYFSILVNYYTNKKIIFNNTIYCVTYRNNSLENTHNFSRYREYFNIACKIHSQLKKIGIETYIQDIACAWWRRMRNVKQLLAYFYLYKITKYFGIKCSLSLFENDFPKIKKYLIWKLIKKFTK
ncbi:MAG: glycosyltransferase [Bacteroidales bacterium]|jgi:glycosyltransferase involved in cell wall biosynthesis|nr:glycosyltransferase [Bacteroidales bacterium]